MLKSEVEAALNQQLNYEQSAAHEYLAMAADLETRNFKGFATYMRAQADEERMHSMKIYDFIVNRGGTVMLGAIPAPPASHASAKAVFEAAWAREKANTESINAVYTLARQHDDYATQTMLQWFIEEQVEEEAWCEEAVGLLDMAGDNPSALLMLDQKYAGLANEPAPSGNG